jgi:hypothetical protein
MGLDYKHIIWAEWTLGFYMLAALVVTLKNTLPVLNMLLAGAF